MMQKLQREYQRARCVALSNADLSGHEGSKFIGSSKSFVQRSIKRFAERSGFHDRRRNGRPKKMNNRYVRIRGEHRTRFFVPSCPVLLLTFVLEGGRTGQKSKLRPAVQYSTGQQDDRTSCPVLIFGWDNT